MDSNTQRSGLSAEDVLRSRTRHGSNTLTLHEKRLWLEVLKDVVTEPMFVLLLAASLIYFLVGQYQEGLIMIIALGLVSGISIFQEFRSRSAIGALQKLSTPHATVLRDSRETRIAIEEIVVGDCLLAEEGEIIAADGTLFASRDFSVNEALLTGESFSVYKSSGNADHVYRGTLVTSGKAYIDVTEVGTRTMLGKLGQSIQDQTPIKTPLQIQIGKFVRNMVWIGALAFIAVVTIHFLRSGNWIQALLQGLTLAMSILPEEIPVAFSTFQALGAFRLLKAQMIVKQPQYVETLGAASVICVDKTGTLTQNNMRLAQFYDARKNAVIAASDKASITQDLVEYAMWASETSPFDPMEKSIHVYYESLTTTDNRKLYTQVHEYPVSGNPPMMTHIFENSSGSVIIAAKGAPERILSQSTDPEALKKTIETRARQMAAEGYRVLAVGKGSWKENRWPLSQDNFMFECLGLIAFEDPIKPNIHYTIEQFNRAGIQVKMMTGDYPETALAIARQAGIMHTNQHVLTGEEVIHMKKDALLSAVNQTSIFARMFPEAKLKVIDALKENGEIVAMTGDGVNDGPALKAAHIGIAMGLRGSEVARNAASLILMDDDLSHMTSAVALGRKIYDNLGKAIQYIISIHIPIILIVLLPLLMGWQYPEIFTPVHVIFLELLMGPTCSILFENEPIEAGTMLRSPRKISDTFLSMQQLGVSILQGLAITAVCLGMGWRMIQEQATEASVRAVVFLTLLFSNIFLTLVNRSFHHTLLTTIRYKNNLVPIILGLSILFIIGVFNIAWLRNLFQINKPTMLEAVYCLVAALMGTFWLEFLKGYRVGKKNRSPLKGPRKHQL